MLCVSNHTANVAADTLHTLLVGQTVWLQRQHGQSDRTQTLESRPHGGGGRVSLDSGAIQILIYPLNNNKENDVLVPAGDSKSKDVDEHLIRVESLAVNQYQRKLRISNHLYSQAG